MAGSHRRPRHLHIFPALDEAVGSHRAHTLPKRDTRAPPHLSTGTDNNTPNITGTPKMNVAVDGEDFRWGRSTMDVWGPRGGADVAPSLNLCSNM